MAKPIICDRCKKVKPEEEMVKPDFCITLGNGFHLGITFRDDAHRPIDICDSCAKELILEMARIVKNSIR